MNKYSEDLNAIDRFRDTRTGRIERQEVLAYLSPHQACIVLFLTKEFYHERRLGLNE